MKSFLTNNPQGISEEENIYNPFDIGIKKAIASSRDNLGMTKDQEHAALRNSMLSMANSLSKNPLERKASIIDNFRTALEGLGPAIQAYDQSEDASLSHNNALAQQILAHKEREGSAKAIEEERLWHRQHAENQLAETKRQHGETNELQNAIFEYKKNGDHTDDTFNNIAPKIMTKSAFDKKGSQTQTAAEFHAEVKDLKDRYEDLKKTMEEDGIDTSNPLVFKKTIRDASGILSSFTKDPKKRAIATKYADVLSSTKRAMQTAEKALKEGALTNFTIKYGDQNDLFPNFNETSDVFETKLKHMLDDAFKGYDSSYLSLQHGRFVDKGNYDNVKKFLTGKKDSNFHTNTSSQKEQFLPPTGTILMRDPITGEQEYIPIQNLNDAILDGLVKVK